MEIAIDYITRMIQKVAWKSTTELKTQERINNYPLEIRRQIAKKRRLRKRWQRTRNPENTKELPRLSKAINQLVNTTKNKTFKSHIESFIGIRKT